MMSVYPRFRHAERLTKQPLITVFIPVFNGGDNFKRCFNSALQQTFGDFEIIIVDNCSTDDTLPYICSIAKHNPRVTVYQNTHNIGRVANWNVALSLVNGVYVKPLMSNDYLLPSCLTTFTQYIERHPNASLLRTSMTSLVNGQTIFSPHFSSDIYLHDRDEIMAGYLEQNLAAGPSFQLWKTQIIREHDLEFDEGLTWAADYEFAFKINLFGDFVYIRQPLIVFDWGVDRFHNKVSGDVKFKDEMQSRLAPFNSGFVTATPQWKVVLRDQLNRQANAHKPSTSLYWHYHRMVGYLNEKESPSEEGPLMF